MTAHEMRTDAVPVDFWVAAATRIAPEPWMTLARCVGQDPEWFFPTDGNQGGHDVARAKAVCGGCPVRAECLSASADESHGVWAGLTAEERAKLHGHRRPRARSLARRTS